jgi:hypothetical protein
VWCSGAVEHFIDFAVAINFSDMLHMFASWWWLNIMQPQSTLSWSMLQMNALHEPWDDGAASDDMSWGPPQQLAAAAAADAEADSVISRATEVYNEALEQAQLAQDQAAVQAARQALEAQLQQPGGLCRGNAKAITLPPNHRNPPVSWFAQCAVLDRGCHDASVGTTGSWVDVL